MSFEIRITLPTVLRKETGINEDTPLETYFEDGELVIRECGEELDARSFDAPIEAALPCRDCEYFCSVHQVCMNGFHINVEEDF